MKIVMTTRMYHYHQSVLVSALLLQPLFFVKEKFEDTKWVIRNCKSKERQWDGQKRTTKNK